MQDDSAAVCRRVPRCSVREILPVGGCQRQIQSNNQTPTHSTGRGARLRAAGRQSELQSKVVGGRQNQFRLDALQLTCFPSSSIVLQPQQLIVQIVQMPRGNR